MAGQPRPRDDANRLGLQVAAAAAVGAAAGAEGTRNGRGVDSGGSGGAGPLREVGGEDERKAGEEGDPPLQRPARQGREAEKKGGQRLMRGSGGGCWEGRSRERPWTVPRRRGRSPGFRCYEGYCSGKGSTEATRKAGQEQDR